MVKNKPRVGYNNEKGGIIQDLLRPGILAGVASMHTGLEPRNLPLNVAIDVIRESGSVALFYHVVSLRGQKYFEAFESPGLTFSEVLNSLPKRKRYIAMANTSLVKNADEAIEHVEISCDTFNALNYTGQPSPIIKLEISSPNRTPIDNEIVIALKEILRRRPGLPIIPLINPEISIMNECIKLGVPALRILTGKIRSMKGVETPSTVKVLGEESKIPLIFEGGIGTPQHVKMAFNCGASAVLVNTAFHVSDNPVALANDLRLTIDSLRYN
ncbi:MAG: hypothetical protein KGH71_04455 [Candidatus Micrarchaeota archaeon]|nr:hypothetical protein [Candidatus Micrarchaeota archaeon]